MAALYGERPAFQRNCYDTALGFTTHAVAASGHRPDMFDGAMDGHAQPGGGRTLAAYMRRCGFVSSNRLASALKQPPPWSFGPSR